MGMAYQSISDYNAPPVFQTLVAQNQVTSPIFSFKLSASGSELLLGGVNNKLYTGSFTLILLQREVSLAFGFISIFRAPSHHTSITILASRILFVSHQYGLISALMLSNDIVMEYTSPDMVSRRFRDRCGRMREDDPTADLRTHSFSQGLFLHLERASMLPFDISLKSFEMMPSLTQYPIEIDALYRLVNRTCRRW